MKDAGKKRKPSRKIKGRGNSRVRTVSIDEDDGTQVETKTPVKKRPTRRVRKSAAIDDPDAQKQLRIFCLKAIETGVEGLVKEFLAIKAETTAAPPKVAFDANKPKNRYQDVFCADQTRVILTWPPSNPSDYVHANWVEYRGEKQFICTQGPTEATVDDFWRLHKLGADHQNLNVIQAEEMLTVSRLQVSSNEPNVEPLEVKHVKWNEWPDRGVPKQKMAPFRLLARIHNIEPILVHCSAGIGRTGQSSAFTWLYKCSKPKKPSRCLQ
uniref:Uncharacterized protein n=1 Tax=Ditylenchus dipsaci TaxID=166011 RepID=A0A915DE17_9BILA